MPYRDHLNRWLVVRLLANMQRIVVARFRTRSDADGYLGVIQRLIPEGKFLVVFDGDSKSADNHLKLSTKHGTKLENQYLWRGSQSQSTHGLR